MTPIMFTDDTNLFISDSNIENLIQTMNEELRKVATSFTVKYLCKNWNAPSFFKHIYTVKPVENHTTRSRNVLVTPLCKKKFANLSWPTEEHTYGINLLPQIITC